MRRLARRAGLVVVLAVALAVSGLSAADAPEATATPAPSVSPAVTAAASARLVTAAAVELPVRRGIDDREAVVRATTLVTEAPRTVGGTEEGLGCLSGDAQPSQGCVVAQTTPELVAPSACAGLSGEFRVQDGTSTPSALVGYTYRATVSSGQVPTTELVDGTHGQTYSWFFVPDSTDTDCFDPDEPVARTVRVDVVRGGIEPSDTMGPLKVGLASGTLSTTITAPTIQLVGGQVDLGLSYRSPGGIQHVVDEPTDTLPSGWTLTGMGGVPPWVTLTQVGSGEVPNAVVLSAFDGTQVEFTNSLAGTSSTTGAWAPPHQAGWPTGQFGTLVDSGDLTASDATFTWSQGQQVVTFARTGDDTWAIAESAQVEAGGFSAASTDTVWESSGSSARIDQLVDPVSGRTATFAYGDGSTCDGVAPPTEGSDVYHAPAGLLCGWTNFDGSMTRIWYVAVGAGTYQVGWVANPGDINTQLYWTVDGTTELLTGIQDALGHDAQDTISDLSETDTSWTINHDLFGNVASVVSPRPGVASVVPTADDDRRARTYAFNTTSDGQEWAAVSHGILADQDDPTEVSAGQSILAEIEFDGAWRPTLAAVESPTDGAYYAARKTWDTVHDRELMVQGIDGFVHAKGYDFLGRVADQWGPAPAAAFAVSADSTSVSLAGGYDDSNVDHSQSSYDADAAGLLAGWTASLYDAGSGGGGIGGVPASTVGSCAEGQCPDPDSPGLSWASLPGDANVSGSWAMQLTASRETPIDNDDGQLRYRVSTDAHGTATLFVNGNCTTDDASGNDCTASNTASPSASAGSGEPLTLQVTYTRDGTAVAGSTPATVTVEESTDGGSHWTTLAARDLDPGFGLPSSTSQNDTLSAGGDVATLVATATFADPERQQVATMSLDATGTPGGTAADVDHTFESYDGATNWGRTLTSTDPAGATVGASYWDPTATATDPCGVVPGTLAQSGLQASYVASETTTGEAAGTSTDLVYDDRGQTVARVQASEDGSATSTTCSAYDDRGQPLELSNGELSTSYDFPWNDPDSTDPFTATVTMTAPDTTGTPGTWTTSTVVDLLGRTVSTTDVWGTTTVTEHVLDPTTGIVTAAATTTTPGGYTSTTTTTQNRDGTTAGVVRADAASTLVVAYGYGADGNVASVVLTDGSGTEIVTETRSYEPATGYQSGATWTRGGSVVASHDLVSAPNGLRLLGEVIATTSATHTWDYTYDGLARLTEATLTSTGSSDTGGSWAYTYEQDTAGVSGENPDAYLNGNVTSRTVTRGGDTTTVDYHYDHADRLTRSSDPALADLVHDSFGNLTRVGADTVTYNDANAPISVTDGTDTVAWTRTMDYQVIEKATSTADGTTTIRYGQDGLVLDGTGTARLQFQSFGSILAQTSIGSPNATTYQLNTIAGDRLLTLDATGTAASATATLYDPYGARIEPPDASGPSTAVPEYGWEADAQAETEDLALPVVMMGARLYVPSMGRFTSPDPKPGASGSEYGYAHGDPINFQDTDGMSPKWWRSFTHWWSHDFVDFWSDDIPKAWSWSFGSGSSWWHTAIGVVVIVVIVIVVIALIVLITVLTGGADAAAVDGLLDVGIDVGVDSAEGAGDLGVLAPEVDEDVAPSMAEVAQPEGGNAPDLEEEFRLPKPDHFVGEWGPGNPDYDEELNLQMLWL